MSSRPFASLSPGVLGSLTGVRVGGRVLSGGQVAAVRRQNAVRPPVANAESVVPVGAAASVRLRQAGRGSGVIDPTRTGTDPAVVQRIRESAGGPGVAGYNALKFALGKNLAAYVPGTQPPLGFHPSPAKAVMNALTLLPPARGAGYFSRGFATAGFPMVARGVDAAQRVSDVAARAALRGYGPDQGVADSYARWLGGTARDDGPGGRAVVNDYLKLIEASGLTPLGSVRPVAPRRGGPRQP